MAIQEQLEIEIAGADVTPETVDSTMLFDLGSEYLELLRDIAQEHGRELTFRGLTVSPGSAVARVWPSDPELAREAGDDAVAYISGAEEPPPGKIESRSRQLARILRDMPAEQTAKVIVGPWRRALKPRAEAAPGYLWASISLRAEVLRVGGIRPAVRVLSPSEEGAFTLTVDKPEDAQKLGPFLYRLVDLTAVVRRDDEGKIVGGTLVEFQPVEDGSAVAAWKDWLKQACPGWEGVDDVLGALGRTKDDLTDDRQ